eukprot:c6684_g1_i1.p1 GENE.c6684_g1_i1~~c6684_g1_i1.p1  ORF type:complete len:254 (-),score=69.16 c6684_g1_i1:376-1098(-)
MAALAFFGVLLIAFGPFAALYIMVINKKAVNAVICMLSAFLMMLALVMCGITWALFSTAHLWFTVIYSVLWIELFRLLLYKLYSSYEIGIARLTPVRVFTVGDDVTSALACGLGSALAQSSLFCVQTLADASSRATAYSDTCPHINVFYSTALHTLAFGVLNIAWTVMMFKARRDNVKLPIVVVVVSHLFASLLTLVGNCSVSLPVLFVLAVGLCAYTVALHRLSHQPRRLYTQSQSQQS